MDFDNALEIAKWLDSDIDVIKINRLKELADNQRYCVTVWGHYSAGKSRLINNILDREILPVQTRETTAVLTYIQYGTQEECNVIYEDGSVKSDDLNILKSVFQNTSDFEEVNKIDHIEVYINNELLRSGLILVDTPGVNTVLQKHQDLAVDAIEQSGRILYVLGNAPSNVDRQFIKQIAACGIKISFVRTKCDKFIETEENAELSLNKEKQDIISFVGTEVDFIPLSNEQTSIWFSNINEVQTLLQKISSKLGEEMKEAIANRLLVYAAQYIGELKSEEQRLTEMLNGNVEEVSDEIKKCENELKRLEEAANSIEKQVEEKIATAQKASKRDLDNLITKRVNNFVQEMEDTTTGIDTPENIKQLYDGHISVSIQRIQGLLNSYFDEIVKAETENIQSCVDKNSLDIPAPTYEEIQQDNSRILKMYNSRLAEAKKNIESIIEERDKNGLSLKDKEAEFDDALYQNALEKLNQELSEIPSGVPLRVAEDQGIQPSSVFKTFGKAVDLTLLLLPGDVIAKGIKVATNTTKVAQTLHKMGKVGEAITSIAKNAGAIDKVRDSAYVLNNVLGKRGYSTKTEKEKAQEIIDQAAKKAGETYEAYKEDKKAGNVLDALSVSYWTEKLGRKFDSPPRMEIDTKEQEIRRQRREEITAEQQQLSAERFKRKKELGLLQDKEKELEYKKQEEETIKQRIEEEIKRQEEQVLQRARKQALDNYKKAYEKYYREALCSIVAMISEQYFRTANQNIAMYVANQNSEMVDTIELKKERINKLLEMKKEGNFEIEQRLSECRELLAKLEMN